MRWFTRLTGGPVTRLLVILIWALLMGGLLGGLVQAQNDIGNYEEALLATRADLELVSNEALGEGTRPPDWTFNINNTDSPTYLADLWYDNEQLAVQQFGETRPPGWIGVPITANPLIVLRNIRHDLEVTADAVFGLSNRPPDWRGSLPLFRCERTIMNTVDLMDSRFAVDFDTTETAVNYCQTIASEAQEQLVNVLYNDPEFASTIPQLILAGRGDLERLADELLGLNTRPEGWVGNRDAASPTLLSDTYLDLERLADDQLGIGQRPESWLGSPPTVAIYGYRWLRFNLEILADTLGFITRPRGWQGTNPVETCSPAIQNLTSLAVRAFEFDPAAVVAAPYCTGLEIAANSIIENPPVLEENEGGGDQGDIYESDIAFTYLDVAATQYMGIMPRGIEFKAWYRNFGDSNMMFISGEGFAVFVDRRWTTLPIEIFDRLPSLEGVRPLTFCDASWCNGPGPTPTPTGFGALQALINAGTPPAAPDINQVQTQKQQVSWNNIRVTYVLDNATARSAQVTLEICTDTQQTVCEPVTAIFDNATGTPKPVLSQLNGLNVYEFTYGYTSNLLIEGSTLFSPDVWISDPTIR